MIGPSTGNGAIKRNNIETTDYVLESSSQFQRSQNLRGYANQMEDSGDFYSDLAKHDLLQQPWQRQSKPNHALLSRCQSSSTKRHNSSYSQRAPAQRPAQRRHNNPKSQMERYTIDGKFNELRPSKQRNSRLRTIDGCRQRRQHLVKSNAQPFPINVEQFVYQQNIPGEIETPT